MPFLKRSNKNKVSSNSATPSVESNPLPKSDKNTRHPDTKMTPEEALLKLTQETLPNAASGPYIL
ncbi:hypothetical protein BGX31_003670 [Mortierella sp. GBA43]|nr:hypothetical protein BGX31_003670 [Mortierella sp. GBA43]